MGLGDKFADVMWDEYGVHVTWLPGRSLKVGDVIVRGSGGAIDVETTLIALLERADLPAPDTTIVPGLGYVEMRATRGTTFEAQLSGGVPMAKAAVKFSKASAFLFAAQGGTMMQYEELAPVRSAVLRLVEAGIWQEDWELVTEVHNPSAATLVIAKNGGVRAEVDLTIPNAALAYVKAGAGVSVSGEDAATWVLASGATTMFRSVDVTRDLFGGVHVDLLASNDEAVVPFSGRYQAQLDVEP